MKSIRRSLLLSVVLLIVATLGVVSFVVYRTSAEALRERQQSVHDAARARFEDRRDEALRNRADKLASEVQSNWNWDTVRNQSIASGLSALAAPTSLSWPAPTAVALATSARRHPPAFELTARLSTELKLSDEDIYRDPVWASYEFVQLTSEEGTSWVSDSLSVSGQRLPVVESDLKRTLDAHPHFDTVGLPTGPTVRRVVVKAPVVRYSWVGRFWLPRTEDSVSPSRAVVGLAAHARANQSRAAPVLRPPIGPGSSYSLPNFYLHCAWDLSPDNPWLTELARERDARIAEIDDETDRNIRGLQATLAWTVAGAVAATFLGGWILVGLGLFPLKRLSVAVSQISAKDFRLPLDPRSLPAEINPVAERLSQALTQLQAAFEREKRAAADISHELRTPLAALTTTLEVACRKPRTAEQYRETLAECRAIARQMSLLVERMLMLAWIDAGADEVRPEAVEVGELVGGVAAIAKPLAEVQGLSFTVTVPGPLTVRTDPDKLREVVMNLTHNAIEYNRPGGAVELSAVRGAAGGVVVEVRDTGIGMPPEIHQKIFERFFRGDPARQATGVHAGLGLAIVKEYVDRLGGRLTVDSAVGRGSRFRIELPNAL